MREGELVAELDGAIVGMAWLAFAPRVPSPRALDRRNGDVQSVYVWPDARGRGVGGRLVDAIVEEARAALAEEAQALRAAEHAKAVAAWEAECARLVEKEAEAVRRTAELEAQLECVRNELEVERAAVKAPVADPQATPTPPPRIAVHGLGLASVDSESSATDIDSSDDGFRNPFAFKVSGSDSYSEEDTYGSDEEEDPLAGYEDEEDTDMSIQSSSSYGSEEDLPRQMERSASPTTPRPNQVFTPSRPVHERRATLSKAWKFPFGGAPRAAEPEPAVEDEEDRFFGCLDDREGDGVGIDCSVAASEVDRGVTSRSDLIGDGGEAARQGLVLSLHRAHLFPTPGGRNRP